MADEEHDPPEKSSPSPPHPPPTDLEQEVRRRLLQKLAGKQPIDDSRSDGSFPDIL